MATTYEEGARAEGGGWETVLRRRTADGDAAAVLELRVNGVFVMDTAETGSERALARAALDLVAAPREVLVGGLGLGFTAHEVLGDGRVERVVVVELDEALVGWLRDGTVPHGPGLLAEERLSVVVADVVQAVAEAAPASYDLVLLDVDNGPDQLVHDGNAAVYDAPFLTEVRRLLRPGGAVAVWSASEAPALVAVLEEVFGAVEEVAHPVRLQDRDETYWLAVARVPSGP